MPILLLTILLFAGSCTAINEDLQRALSYGKITEANEYSPQIEKKLYIRLYQAPVYGVKCFEETHGVCRYRDFMTLATYDEYPETGIFPLKLTGEIKNIEWRHSKEIDSAVLYLTVHAYTAEALENNPDLQDTVSIVRIKASPASIEETTMRRIPHQRDRRFRANVTGDSD